MFRQKSDRFLPPANSLVPLREGGKAGGFSLVEILVSVAILASLALLLQPAIRKSIAQSQGVRCLNNQRSWMTALNLHLADNDGKLPVSVYTVGSPVDATDALYPYLGKNSKIEAWATLFCPTRKLSGSGSQTSLWGTFGFNSFVSEMRVAALPEKSRIIYIADTVGGSRWASFSVLTGTGPASFAGGVPRPHSRCVNVTYLDGHAEPALVSSLTWADFTRGSPNYFSAHETRLIGTPQDDR